jgi:hypothetical protein
MPFINVTEDHVIQVNVNHITHLDRDPLSSSNTTCINLVTGGGLFVDETPAQILTMIKECHDKAKKPYA